VGGLVGLLDLTEDFRLAEQHGIESANNLAKVPCGVGLTMEIEWLYVTLHLFREPILELPQGLRRVLGGEIKLGSVAGGDHHSLGRARRL
jgi:hypothetical protein